jgi:hypothetical protein
MAPLTAKLESMSARARRFIVSSNFDFVTGTGSVSAAGGWAQAVE